MCVDQFAFLLAHVVLGVSDARPSGFLLGVDHRSVVRVVSTEQAYSGGAAAFGADLGDGIDTLEQFEVVAADDEHPRVSVHGRIQSFSCNAIQVVGRLVQQQYIWFGEQLRGESQQHRFATGQRADRSIQVVEGADDAAQTELVQQRQRALLDVPGRSDDGEIVLGRCTGFDAMQCLSDRIDGQHAIHRELGVECDVLTEITQDAGHRDRTALRCQFSGEQSQEGRLSGTVRSDETCCAAGEDGRQRVEHGVAVGPGERQIGDREGR
ncbi:hypothetical protein RhoFasGS6_02845 [Rhodococcus fascians]|nr:hypothetical protein [Rhodococcus fascians]